MNEELQNALVNFVSMITSAAETAGGFAAEQMPEVIEQLIAFSMIKAAFCFVILSIPIIAHIMWVVHIFRSKPLAGGDGALYWDSFSGGVSIKEGAIFVCVMTSVLTIPPIPFAIAHAIELLKLVIAPKVWLIEYAAGLVK